MNRLRFGTISVALFVHGAAVCAAEQSCTPGPIRTDTTQQCISIEWDLTGDSNHNASCAVQYRKQGVTEWKKALPLFRVDYQWWYHDKKADQPFNLFAGSILYLEPGATYEVQLNLSDPDGGRASKTIVAATRSIPQLPKDGRTLHVVAGAGGGSGARDDPFNGLKEAQTAAKPGDILLLDRGDYGSFTFEKSGEAGKHLVWKAAEDGGATFSAIRVVGSHLWFEGLQLQRKDEPQGLRAAGAATDVVVCRNSFNGFHYSILLKPACRDWHITDNVIVGDNDPNLGTNEGGISGEGIELSYSSGHVVAYNSISHVADGVSYPERNVDIYGNDIFDVSDDGLEPDYGFANIRMWNNRITNVRNNALSFQPMKCGPWYFIRNVVVGQSGIFKFRVQDRVVFVNNTFVRWGPAGNRMHHILSSLSRNNLYIGADGKSPIWTASDCNQPQYCLPNNYERNWMTDVDYDGFDWGDSAEAFQWNNRRGRYKDLRSFADAVGIEQHATRVRKEDIFETWSIPAAPARVAPGHLPLRRGANAIDAGAAVPNIAERFTGKAPDLGAYEFGTPLPHYGPRPK